MFWFSQHTIKLPLKYNLLIYTYHTVFDMFICIAYSCTHRCEDINMYLTETGCGLDSSDAGNGQPVVSYELNFWLDKELLPSEGGLCSIDIYIFDTYFSCL